MKKGLDKLKSGVFGAPLAAVAQLMLNATQASLLRLAGVLSISLHSIFSQTIFFMNFFPLALLLAPAFAAPLNDLVTALPGWDQPLPSKMYSGFISGGSDTQDGKVFNTTMWYMLLEAEVPDPSSLPLLLWSNGGPGASSAFGLFTELGSFYLSDQSTKTNPPTLFRNPYAWTKLANILILNGPAPVGYSYCNGNPAGNGYACGSWNDTRTFEHNFAFLNNFFDAFPEYKKSELYLAGESYAGVYIGMLASGLLNASTTLNFKGIALGDACMGNQVLCGPGGQRGPWLSLLFSAGQGCISLPTFEAILAECPMAILKNGPISSAPPACQAAITASGKECPGNAYYGYNYLDQCPPQAFNTLRASDPVLPPAQPSGYPCGGEDALTTWITHPLVKKALHVAPNAVFNSFDNGEGFVYNVTFDSNLPLLRRLQTGKDGVRVLMYNGESECACVFWGVLCVLCPGSGRKVMRTSLCRDTRPEAFVHCGLLLWFSDSQV